MAVSPPSWLQAGPGTAGDQAFDDMLRQSTMVDWIYGGVVFLGLVVMTLNLTQPQAYAAPTAGVIISALAVLSALVLRKTRAGRTGRAIAAFVLVIYGMIVTVAHFNGLGIRTPALNVGPVLLFVAACVAPMRVAVMLGLATFGMLLTLVPISPEVNAAQAPSTKAVMLSATNVLAFGGILGVGVGRVLRQTIAASATAAQLHYQQVFSEQSQRTLRAVVDASPYGIVLSELYSGRIQLFNAAFARIIGRAPEEIHGQTGPSLGAWANPEQVSRIIERIGRGEMFEEMMEIRRPDGSTLPVQGTAIGLEIDGVQHMMLIGRDISPERRRQLELRAVMDTAEAAIVVIQGGHLISVSRRFEQLMGFAPGSAIGQSAAAPLGGEEALQAVHEQYAPALSRGEVVRFEHTARRQDGTTFEGRFTGRLINPGMRDGYSTVALIEDITEEKRHQQQLVRAREDALAASRAKTEFLARMSHELRTPLNGVLGLAELAADPRIDEVERQAHLSLMLESGRAMGQLLSDILDISKIEAGRLELQHEVFELGPWLQGIRASFIWSVESKGLRLVVQASEEAQGWVHADPVRLRQILVNYLANAIKFTFRGEIAVVLSRPHPERLRVEVRDTGMGISEEAQQRLFAPFEQTVDGIRHDGSTGLGLVICRELAQRMNGAVGVSSVVGQGSTFWAEVLAQPAAAPPAEQTDPARPVQTEPPPLRGLRILLADDNRVNQVVAERMLERAGAQVESALNGREAVDSVEQAYASARPFDVVLMDVQMPVMDGIEATRRIRGMPAGQGLLIVAATAAALQEELDAALAQGMDAAITKPFDSVKLTSTILQAMARSSAQLPHGNHRPRG